MNKNNLFADKVINLFFCFAIIICCMGMLYALVVFVQNCNYLRLSVSHLVNNYNSILDLRIDNDTYNNAELESGYISEKEQGNRFDQANYVESLIDYAIKIQQLEANSASNNILTFLYTFLSGSLIGVAAYFTKKNYDSIKQIEKNKELLASLDSRTLFSNLYMYAQRAYSTMHIFSISLDAIQDVDALSEIINKYVPILNDSINEMYLIFNNKKNDIKNLNIEEKKNLMNEVYGICKLIDNIRAPQTNHPLITNGSNDLVKEMWKEQLDNIKNILKM